MKDSTNSSLKSYQTFIIRIWSEEKSQQVRLVLLDAVTGERWIFTQFQTLSEHLQQKNRQRL